MGARLKARRVGPVWLFSQTSMTERSLNEAARDVLKRYSFISEGTVPQKLGNAGGFSGARLWRVRSRDAGYILKAWPENGIKAERLIWIHQLMAAARGSGLSFVPEVATTKGGLTFTEHVGRIWDLTSLVEGCADFHQQPGTKRLQNACLALAELHIAWSSSAPCTGVCPGVRQRLRRFDKWDTLTRSGWKPLFSPGQPQALRIWCERAWQLIPSWIGAARNLLAPWAERPLPLQPCLRDIWHDHVFFVGEEVTGIIDFGSVRIDHVAVDLARVLGSMVEDDGQARAAGLDSYSHRRPLSGE